VCAIGDLAADLLRKAAATGDNDAKIALAALCLQAEDTARDPPRAKLLLKEAAESGHTGAALQLGHLLSGKLPFNAEDVDTSEAIKWYTKAAEAGEIEAQYALGMLYVNGNGVPADLVKAANWIEMAAHKDHAVSQFQLGVMYCTGKGVPQDFPRAIAWYELAAQLGYAPAQYNLGIMLSKGQGCEPDHDRALQWLQKAAEQGLPAAHTALRDISGQDSFQPQDV
jgi:TPR repeat protein